MPPGPFGFPPQPAEPHKIADDLAEKVELTDEDYRRLQCWLEFTDWLLARGDRSGPT